MHVMCLGFLSSLQYSPSMHKSSILEFSESYADKYTKPLQLSYEKKSYDMALWYG